ncbi:recombinase family protein [Microvirga lenta]|uniref:recombinase family protein n=1 Tax=Microvirga lenta TaxID=2881337 RepID=UPI001CFFB343|nr:recombinase family protein [Microvirga lenta]
MLNIMPRKALTQAVAYLRTSSTANVGADKDSDKRQRAAIQDFASRDGFRIEAEFYDPGVSGADPIESRPGFAALLDKIEGNGVRVVIVEDPSRFARDLVTQELGILALIERGVRVLTSTGDDLTNTDDPFKVAMRQIAGAFAQLEKARLVSKLRVARERKRATGTKVEGRKSYSEINPAMVALAKKLHRYPVNKRQRTLQEVSSELAKAGFLTSTGKRYSPAAISKMVSAKA